MYLLGAVAVAVIALASSSASASTWTKWRKSDGGNGHYYLAVLDPGASWNDARSAASSFTRDSHLVTITSARENAFVFSLIDAPEFWVQSGSNVIGPWLGGFQARKDNEPDRGWAWVTGERFSYTNWAAGQPNNLGNIQDFLHFWTFPPFDRAPTWDDVDAFEGGLARGYVVESNVNPIPLPGSGLLLVAGLGGLAWARRRRAVRVKTAFD